MRGSGTPKRRITDLGDAAAPVAGVVHDVAERLVGVERRLRAGGRAPARRCALRCIWLVPPAMAMKRPLRSPSAAAAPGDPVVECDRGLAADLHHRARRGSGRTRPTTACEYDARFIARFGSAAINATRRRPSAPRARSSTWMRAARSRTRGSSPPSTAGDQVDDVGAAARRSRRAHRRRGGARPPRSYTSIVWVTAQPSVDLADDVVVGDDRRRRGTPRRTRRCR